MPDKKTTSTASAAAKKAAAKKAATAAKKQTAPATTAAKDEFIPVPNDCTYIVLTDQQFDRMMSRCGGGEGEGKANCCDLDESVKQLAEAVGTIAKQQVLPTIPRYEDRQVQKLSLAISDIRLAKNSGGSYRDTDFPDTDC